MSDFKADEYEQAERIAALRKALEDANRQAKEAKAELKQLRADISGLMAERDDLQKLVRDADNVSHKYFGKWLCDAIDNSGQPYQSKWANELIFKAASRSGHGKKG